MNFLKNHPFAVEAFFDSSIVLTFAAPKEQLQGFLPDCLQLDTFQDKWAFIAVAMVQTRGLRPKGFPEWMGNDFFLIGYRIFVRYNTLQGKNLRGLYIIKSETDRKKMAFFGNIFTHYNYSSTDIQLTQTGDTRNIQSRKSGFNLVLEQSALPIPLPEGSPFSDWKEARRYAGPLPFTFTYKQQDRSVLIIEGVRQNWTPEPVKVRHFDFEFIRQLNIPDIVLANAFEIKKVPYYWKKGRKETWR